MDRVRIETTQNVPIEYEIANIGDRLLAALIDWLILLACLFLVVIINPQLPAPVRAWLGWSIVFLIFLYDPVCEIFLNGQTIGKKARHIKVARLDGSQPNIGNYLLRWLLRPIDIGLSFGGIALVAILWSGRGQRLGDLLAGTTVIKLKQEVSLEDTILTHVARDHTVMFPEVGALTDEDMTIIKEVLTACSRLEDAKLRRQLARKTQEKITRKMGIQTGLFPEVFLEQVLKDYNFLNGQI